MENSTERTVDELIDRYIYGGNPEEMRLCAEQLMAGGEPGPSSSDPWVESGLNYYLGDNAFTGVPSWVVQTFTSNNTYAFDFGNQNRTFEDMQARLHQLEEENASYRLETERLNDLLDAFLDEEEMTRTDLFLLQQREKMEEKGWILAFLSPSVLDLLDECAVEEFLEENIRFIYDVEIPSEEE